LFLSLYTGYATEAYALLFGQVLGISQRDVLIILVAAAVTLAMVAVLYRPLLFASVDEEVAEARGVRVRFLSIAFMVVLHWRSQRRCRLSAYF
jgi:zinc/manganese transport system permease protein